MGNTVSFKKEFGLIVVGAIIFTASFLWKDLLTDIEEHYFPKGQDLSGRIIFTVVITAILVLVAVHLKTIFNLNSTPAAAIQFDDDPIDGGGHGIGMDLSSHGIGDGGG